MKLATLRDGSRDGALLVVSRDLTTACSAQHVVPTLQAAIDNWARVRSALVDVYDALNAGRAAQAFPLSLGDLAAPLPRAYQFLDGSAYPAHMRSVRQARGVAMPSDFETKPLLYQGNSDRFLAHNEPIQFHEDEALGIDFEGEVVVVTDDVPQGISATQASAHVILLGLLNDTSLRSVIAQEIPRGFGFMQGKPARTLGPVFVTPDELGTAWNGKLLAGTFVCEVRGEKIGSLDPSKGASFGYHQLIAHGARTRDLAAGTLVGLGALAAPEGDRSRGSGCIAEQRAHEQLSGGQATTPFLRFGDEVAMEMFDAAGRSIFGAIRQRVRQIAS